MLNNYEHLTDEDLLLLSQKGDSIAGSELARRYRPLIKRCTRPYYLLGGDAEDLIQEGMIGLVQSMQSFEKSGGASFKSYAELCIRRRILDAIKAAGRLKHMPLNTCIPLEDLEPNEDISHSSHGNVQYIPSPERLLIEQEEKQLLYTKSRAVLSPLEQKVLSGYLDGLSYDEIARHCRKPVKSVDSALQRIRKKLAAAMQESE